MISCAVYYTFLCRSVTHLKLTAIQHGKIIIQEAPTVIQSAGS